MHVKKPWHAPIEIEVQYTKHQTLEISSSKLSQRISSCKQVATVHDTYKLWWSETSSDKYGGLKLCWILYGSSAYQFGMCWKGAMLLKHVYQWMRFIMDLQQSHWLPLLPQATSHPCHLNYQAQWIVLTFILVVLVLLEQRWRCLHARFVLYGQCRFLRAAFIPANTKQCHLSWWVCCENLDRGELSCTHIAPTAWWKWWFHS